MSCEISLAKTVDNEGGRAVGGNVGDAEGIEGQMARDRA